MNTFELRAQLENDFICALMAGLARRACEPGDALAVCPVEMLAEGGIPRTVYQAVEGLHKSGVWPTVPGVFEYLARTGANVAAADLAGLMLSTFGHEAGVQHFAASVRREGIKRMAEGVFAGLHADARHYGNDPEDWRPQLDDLARCIDGGGAVQTTLADVLDRVMAAVENGSAAPPLPTPWASLNSVLKGGLVPGEMVVLAARPGLGKTALAGCMAVETAKNGKGVLFVSREVADTTIAARLLAREARVDARVFRQGVAHADPVIPAIRAASSRIRNLPLRIVEKSTVPMTPREVRRLARTTANIGLVVVDYLQLLNPDDKHHSREREVAEMSRSMKQLALDCACPVLVLSQLNRASEDADSCPNLSDLRESGAIEQDADIVMFLHTKKAMRSLVKAPVQVEVAKGRSSGTGTAYLLFDKPYANFEADTVADSWKKENRRSGDEL